MKEPIIVSTFNEKIIFFLFFFKAKVKLEKTTANH